MSKYFFDLHIHSAVSPCAENEMTPNNIVNMSMLKGLDFIAVTDHNIASNIDALLKCAQNKDIIIVPGMEVETSEEIHVITLFKSVKDLNILSEMVYDSLPNVINRVDIFGQQLIFNHLDQIIDHENKYLLTACGLSIDDVVKITNDNNGLVIPAHIFRNSYSIINTLGCIPKELSISVVEISNDMNKKELMVKYPYLNNYRIVTSSDAHRLADILEPIQYIELKEKSIECLFESLINA